MPGGKHGARAIAEDDYDDYYDDEEDYYDEDEEEGIYKSNDRKAQPQTPKTDTRGTQQSAQHQSLDQDEEELNSLLAQLIPDLGESRREIPRQARAY